MMIQVRDIKTRADVFTPDLLNILRSLQLKLKPSGRHIQESPWVGIAVKKPYYPATVGASHVPLPMTPQSAALGPAVQATVPSTPQSAYFGGPRHRFGSERTETSTSMSGSMSNSRNGTMTTNNQELYVRSREDQQYTSSDNLSINTGVFEPTSAPSPAPHSSFASRGYNYKAGIGN